MPLLPKILLAENDPAVRREISARLRGEGFLVVEAGDGKRALEMVADGSFDLVVLELAIPGLNGFQLAEKVHSRSPETPIIFTTAYVPERLGRRILRGRAEFLEKRVVADTLLPLVNRLLHRSPASRKKHPRVNRYRRRIDRQSWHFSPACSNWPTGNYEQRLAAPKNGELCNECRAKSEKASQRS